MRIVCLRVLGGERTLQETVFFILALLHLNQLLCCLVQRNDAVLLRPTNKSINMRERSHHTALESGVAPSAGRAARTSGSVSRATSLFVDLSTARMSEHVRQLLWYASIDPGGDARTFEVVIVAARSCCLLLLEFQISVLRSHGASQSERTGEPSAHTSTHH